MPRREVSLSTSERQSGTRQLTLFSIRMLGGNCPSANLYPSSET